MFIMSNDNVQMSCLQYVPLQVIIPVHETISPYSVDYYLAVVTTGFEFEILHDHIAADKLFDHTKSQ